MSTEETDPLLDTGASNPGYDETGEQIEMENLNTDKSRRRGNYDPTSSNKKNEETSFSGGASETEKWVETSLKNIDEALARIKRKFPNFDPANSPFTFGLDKFDQVIVKLKIEGGKYHQLFNKDGDLNEKLPKTIIDYLGSSAKKIIETNEEEIEILNKKISELQSQLETALENQKENISQTINRIQDMKNQLEIENEKIEQRMTLRDRVKAIFRKYGFTILAVASAVGVVIGVIVANLKKWINIPWQRSRQWAENHWEKTW